MTGCEQTARRHDSGYFKPLVGVLFSKLCWQRPRTKSVNRRAGRGSLHGPDSMTIYCDCNIMCINTLMVILITSLCVINCTETRDTHTIQYSLHKCSERHRLVKLTFRKSAFAWCMLWERTFRGKGMFSFFKTLFYLSMPF